MKRSIPALFCALLLAVPALSFAQDAPKEISKAYGKKTITVAKPAGWVVAAAPKGSIGLLRAAGDKNAQIEVKFTPRVTPEQKVRYFETFHTNLKKMGFKVSKVGAAKEIPDFVGGKETHYAVKSKGKPFTMVVWEGHREGGVWLVIGFFSDAATKTHYPKLEEVTKGILIK